ncbi:MULTISPECIES: EAL domain-containing protein [unclassified Photobacterium]|uniref:EAL domain-containing protein n=1 Tax=unclassified Photobacterium TaxID=2628852 RepID=UPI000D15901D|nr:MULTISPECIES: EAL domain-containing protein [unclassified Photobacterium]PSV34449.1 EAL domain-containing protein [Photobacterium sp. GB-210]PSV50996.1 EAL domain-containing protein [Photobacterium sp. GB-1]
MNIKYMKLYTLIVCSTFFFIIFACGTYLLYQHDIDTKIHNEHEIQRKTFYSVVDSKDTLVPMFSKMTIPTLAEQRELKRYVSDHKDVSSISVIYNDYYVYSTFGNRLYSMKMKAVKGFNIKVKSLLTHKPTLSYTLQVGANTYLKIYFKPLRFNVIDSIGRGYITVFDNIEIGEGNQLVKHDLLNHRDEYYFHLDDADFFVDVDPALALKQFIETKYVYLLMLLLGCMVSSYTSAAYCKKIWVRVCIKRNIIRPYLQPIVNKEGDIIGAEVLARWITKKGQVLPPYLFIPYIESQHLTSLLTCSLMTQVYQSQLMVLSKQLKLSFNLTERCLFDESIYKASLLLAPKFELVLEFTESAPFSNVHVKARMEKFHQNGMFFALDDYGTGYSSPYYLTDYNFDYLKIDRCFIEQIEHNPKSIYVVESLVLLAQKLELSVISEGVETEKQKQMLDQWGIKQYQGFYFYKPMSIESFMDIYSSH